MERDEYLGVGARLNIQHGGIEHVIPEKIEANVTGFCIVCLNPDALAVMIEKRRDFSVLFATEAELPQQNTVTLPHVRVLALEHPTKNPGSLSCFPNLTSIEISHDTSVDLLQNLQRRCIRLKLFIYTLCFDETTYCDTEQISMIQSELTSARLLERLVYLEVSIEHYMRSQIPWEYTCAWNTKLITQLETAPAKLSWVVSLRRYSIASIVTKSERTCCWV